MLGAYLEDGLEVAITRPMRGGVKYMLLGGGSEGIEDLNLAVESADGRLLKADTMDDAAPVVEVTPPSDGKYRIRLSNAKNGSGGGFGVVVIMREGGYSVPVANFVRSFGSTLENAAQAVEARRRARQGRGRPRVPRGRRVVVFRDDPRPGRGHRDRRAQSRRAHVRRHRGRGWASRGRRHQRSRTRPRTPWSARTRTRTPSPSSWSRRSRGIRTRSRPRT